MFSGIQRFYHFYHKVYHIFLPLLPLYFFQSISRAVYPQPPHPHHLEMMTLYFLYQLHLFLPVTYSSLLIEVSCASKSRFSITQFSLQEGSTLLTGISSPNNREKIGFKSEEVGEPGSRGI